MTARVPGAPEPAIGEVEDCGPARPTAIETQVAGAAEPEVDSAAAEPELTAAEPEADAVAVEPEIDTPATEPIVPPPATDRAARFRFISRFFPRTVPEPPIDREPFAEAPQPAPPLEPVPDLEPEPEPEPAPTEPAPEPEPEPEPAPVEPIDPPTEPDQPDPPFEPAASSATGADDGGRDADPGPGPDTALAVLNSVLDDLGSAHHRPFSRG